MDDTYSADYDDNREFYKPYKKWYPRKLTRFLQLLDYLGIPHKKPKQLFGRELVVIGLEVDAIKLETRIPPDAKALLLGTIDWFIARRQRTLGDY